jgi:hypothetical protein
MTLGKIASESLQMCKRSLRSEQKMSEAYVADARRWAGVLLQREHRGPGDTVEAAMWRAEQKWGIDHCTFWALRYRPPKDIVVGVYMRLKAAYDAACEAQERQAAHAETLAREAGINETNSRLFKAATHLARSTGAQE